MSNNNYYFKPEDVSYFGFNIPKVEAAYNNAKYVGYWAIKTKNGNWSEYPVDVFYQPTREKPEYSDYFGLFRLLGWEGEQMKMGADICITNAASAFENEMDGLVAEDGEVIVSHYRHDMRYSRDGQIYIDGGRDYTRSGGKLEKVRFVKVKMVDGELKVLEEENK